MPFKKYRYVAVEGPIGVGKTSLARRLAQHIAAETLLEKGIGDVEALAATSIDDLVDFLDVSMDEAQAINAAANSIVAAKNAEVGEEGEEAPETAEADAGDAEPPVEAESEDETAAEEQAEPEAAEEETEVSAAEQTDEEEAEQKEADGEA